nr:odorant receptor 2 [Periplaneta americana]
MAIEDDSRTEPPPRFAFFNTMNNIAGIRIINKPTLLYSLYSYFGIIINYCCIIGQTVDMFQHLDDLDRTIETTTPLFPMTACVWIDFYTRLRKKLFRDIIFQADEFTWEELPTKDKDTGWLTMAGLIPLLRKTCVYFGAFMFTSNAIYFIYRGASSRDKLGLNSWFPFDTRPSPVHEIIVALQIYAMVGYTSAFYGFLSMYATYIAIICCQIEKMQIELGRFRSHGNDEVENKQTKEEEGLQSVSRKEDDESLMNCIDIHCKLLSFMDSLENLLNPLILGHFILIIGSTCFAAYSAVTNWSNWESMFLVLIVILCMPVLLALYCMLGETITTRVDDLKNSIWFCNWVGANKKQQNAVLMMLIMANKGFCLTAGGIAPVSRNTMSVVLNQVMSYTMFLVNFKELEE